jgi:hypothetical protein
MPNDTLIKINKTCNIPIDVLERKWEESKKLAGESNYGLTMTIFKNKISKSCLSKLGWNKELNEALQVGIILSSKK